MESSMESDMEKTAEEPVEQASGHRYKKIDEADVPQERPSNRIRSKLKDASKVGSVQCAPLLSRNQLHQPSRTMFVNHRVWGRLRKK